MRAAPPTTTYLHTTLTFSQITTQTVHIISNSTTLIIASTAKCIRNNFGRNPTTRTALYKAVELLHGLDITSYLPILFLYEPEYHFV